MSVAEAVAQIAACAEIPATHKVFAFDTDLFRGIQQVLTIFADQIFLNAVILISSEHVMTVWTNDH